jgi:hypothetical protein
LDQRGGGVVLRREDSSFGAVGLARLTRRHALVLPDRVRSAPAARLLRRWMCVTRSARPLKPGPFCILVHGREAYRAVLSVTAKFRLGAKPILGAVLESRIAVHASRS